jgi:hypothetical protein
MHFLHGNDAPPANRKDGLRGTPRSRFPPWETPAPAPRKFRHPQLDKPKMCNNAHF